MTADRLSGRVEWPPENYLLRGTSSGVSADDSVGRTSAASARVRAEHADQIAAQLTDLDRCIVHALATVRIATGGQLRRLFWPDTETGKRLARHHLAKLTKLRVLGRLDRRIGGVRAGSEGFTYSLDVVGARLATRNGRARVRRPRTPGLQFMDHALAVTECFVQLHELHALEAIELLSFEPEPTCWRDYSTRGGGTATIKPDAKTVVGSGEFEDTWYLEVDRGTEAPIRLASKATEYVAYWETGTEQQQSGVFPRVLWIAPAEARASVITTALRRLPAEHWQLFQVCTTDGFKPTITGGVVDLATRGGDE